MQDVLTKYERGELNTIDVEESMEFHCQALEKIGFKGIDKIRYLNYQLVNRGFE